MTDMQRVNKLWESMFESMHQKGHGVYDRIDLDIDDFKFLIDLSNQQHDLIERYEKALKSIRGSIMFGDAEKRAKEAYELSDEALEANHARTD